MRALDRKLLRDSVHMWGQFGAIALIVASAIATYVTMRGSYEALLAARTVYYESARFADVFASVKRAPLRVADDIRNIAGVSAVDARIVVDVPLDVPRLTEPATARVVSLDGNLNRVRLRIGRLPEPDSTTEVVASEQFAGANGLRPGDSLAAVLNGKWQELRIVGIGSSPEYLIEISGAAAVPDHRRFAVLWMPRPALEASFSMRGAFNEAAVLLSRGGDEQRVRDRIDQLLGQYGGFGAYGRLEHHPHRVIESEIRQLRVGAVIDPLVFLLVCAFLINMVLSRLIAGQRDQIAILKAFGYSSRAIAAHYASFALIIVAAGSIIGVPFGVWFGRSIIQLYLDSFSLPQLHFSLSVTNAAASIAVTGAAAVGGALRSAFGAAAVPPAEGMRGEQPPLYRASTLDRLHRRVSSAARMILRSIERRPVRAFLSSLGIAFAVMMLLMARYTYDAVDGLLTTHLRTAERHDVMLTFVEPRRSMVRNDLARLPAVQRVETFFAVPVRISAGNHSRRIALMGLQPDGRLRRLVDRNMKIVSLPDHGVVLTTILADVLGVARGGRVHVETLDRKRVAFDADVSATVDELAGINAFATVSEVERMTRETDLVTGAYLAVDRASRSSLDQQLKRMPVIGSAVYREQMIASFTETVAKNLSTSTRVVVFFACVIAFGVVYNSARIALSERGRDLATLRVLGFSRRETGALLLGEQAVLTCFGIPLGFVFGRAMSQWISHLFTTEEYRLMGEMSATTYAFSVAVVLGASLLSAIAVWRRIARLDLVEVLKTRE